MNLNITPPKAEKIDHKMTLHGDTRIDPYFWLKNRDSEPVLKYLNQESQYYQDVTSPLVPLQERIFEEMKARVKEDDSTVPYKDGNFYYYVRFEQGKEYPIYCRKQTSLENKEEIILNVNDLAKNQKYTSVGEMQTSPNHEWIVYAVDFVGRRFYDLYFKNLKTGKLSQFKVPQTTGNVVWANDNETLFYVQQNTETLRSEKVFRFSLKDGISQEIYFEKDEIFNVGISRSLTGKYLFLDSSSFDSSEIRFLDANQPKSEWKIFSPREKKHLYSVDDGGDAFYIVSNKNAENFKIMKTEYQSTDQKNWQTVVPHRQDTLISGFEMFKDQMILSERYQGLTQINVWDRKTQKSDVIKFPDATYVVSVGTNEEFEITDLRLSYESLTRPRSTFDYNISEKKLVLKKQNEVPTYNSSLYESDRIWATASDGVKIPISLVYRKDLKKKQGNPTLVYGYGSYGYSMDPNFRLSIVSLMDRGFVYAIAHVRGGSEMGRAWYEAGRMNNKKNTFTDFVTVTKHLQTQKIADSKNTFAMGGSAGGLLMGAITNLAPELYKGIVTVVPFVDALTTMLDPDIPLTTGEYEQWGNPNEKEVYHYIKSYSPYDNLTKRDYPAILAVTGYHDSQVQYWEPAKYIAKVRELNTGKAPVLFKIDMNAGHSGASGRFAALKDLAHQYAFILSLAEGN